MGLLLNKFPYITMDSGIVVCNFTSFHDYWLRADEHDTIGEILPGCTKVVSDAYKLDAIEKESTFRIDYVDVDIILVPFLLMDLLKATDGHATIQEYRGLHKVRTCKKIDVRDVNQGIFNNRFCK